MFVTIINIKTGESKTGSLKEISKQVNRTIATLRKYRAEKVIIFDQFSISFNWEKVKGKQKGNKQYLKSYKG